MNYVFFFFLLIVSSNQGSEETSDPVWNASCSKKTTPPGPDQASATTPLPGYACPSL